MVSVCGECLWWVCVVSLFGECVCRGSRFFKKYIEEHYNAGTTKIKFLKAGYLNLNFDEYLRDIEAKFEKFWHGIVSPEKKNLGVKIV